MRHRTLCAAIVALALCLAVAGLGPAAAKEPTWPTPEASSPLAGPEPTFLPGELLVKFRTDVSASAQAGVMARYQAAHIRTLYGSDVQLYGVPAGQELELAAQLAADPGVAYAEPNYLYQADVDPNDPYLSRQWAHTRIHSRQAWDITQGSAAVTVAILDTGIDESHPDLASKVVAGYDFVDGDANPHDLHGHGTHVAGIAAAATHNSVGVAGMSWYAKIMPVRVLNEYGSGSNASITEGINWAWQHGAKVINMSLGGIYSSQAMQDAVNAAHAAGTLVVAAMGNCRTGCYVGGTYYVNPTNYPAAYSNVLAVAATGPSDVYSFFSQYGPHCDIAAPGGEMGYYHDPDGIYSTMPTYAVNMTTASSYSTWYDYVHGTSQASPYVAGLAALIWAAQPSLTPDQVQDVIEDTAQDLGAAGWDSTYGYGLIDALAALSALQVPVRNLDLTSVVTSTGVMTATLGWTPPAGAALVAIRHSALPITTANWGSATLLTGTLSGAASSYVATVPYSGGKAFFALRWQNGDGQWSEVSNNAFWPSYPTYLPLVLREHSD